MRFRFFLAIGAIPCVLAGLLSSCAGSSLPVARQFQAGRLDLAAGVALQSSPVEDRPVALVGKWQHFPGRLLYPVDFEQGSPAGGGFERPGLEGRAFGRGGGHGYGTYHLTILGTHAGQEEGLVVPALGSAYTMWVNGAKVAQSGRVATSTAGEVPAERSALALFSSVGSADELVVQVSAFHAQGGSDAPILFGSRRAILAYDALSHGMQWSLTALLALAFLLAVAGFFASRGAGRERGFPFVAMLAVAGALGALTAQSLFGIPLPGPATGALPWGIGARADELAFFLYFPLAYLAAFGRSGTRGVRGYSLMLAIAAAFMTIVPLFLPTAWFARIATVGGGLLALGLLYPLARAAGIGGAGSRGAEGGAPRAAGDPWFAAGLSLLFLGLAADLLAGAGYVPIGSTSPAAALLFVLIVAVPDLIGRPAARGAATPAAGGATRAAHASSTAEASEGRLALLAEELRKPIQGIVSLAESVLSTPSLPEGQVLSLSLIASSAMRLASAVSDIADDERLERGGVELALGPVAVDQVVERAVEVCQPLLAGRSVQLRNELSQGLPVVKADAGRLERIIYNVIAEAIARLEAGSVVVQGEARDGAVELRIEGEPSREVAEAGEERIAPRRVPAELGRLGLAVAEELIRLHNGEITARSDASGDAHFILSFTLPQAEWAPSEPPKITEELIRLDGLETAQASPGETPDDRSFRILIADDDPISLQTMRNQLIAEHYRVTTTMNGEQALAIIKADPPDLVLADAMVSKVGGYDICRAVRQTYSANELPVLILVDPNEMMGLMEGLGAGANDFITKPIVLDEFVVRVKTHLNLAKINSLYSRFVPIELLHFLGHDNIVELKLGDQIQREMTILFVDIRAFTNLSERMTPQENFKFINSYLSRITPIIRQNNGFIDKYIGDAILALYPGSPEDALRSAIRMVEYLHEYNGYRKNSGYRPINIGIGIHTGNLIVGIIGDNERMQGTVISDAVNLASRVQDVTKLYGANIIISQDTFVRLENPTAYNFRFLGKVKVKGKDQTVSLFEIFDGELPERIAAKSKTKQAFEDAILLFSQRKLEEAAAAFRRIISQSPDDRAAALFLNRAEWLLKREKASWLLR